MAIGCGPISAPNQLARSNRLMAHYLLLTGNVNYELGAEDDVTLTP